MSGVVQIVLLVGLAPLLHGAMKRLRANLQGRPGPSPVQPYRDLAKLWSKEALLPADVSPVALVAPGIALGVACTFAVVVPFASGVPPIDAVALALLLAAGRFALTLAALDTRSAFAAMAASREATFGALVEPALLVALLGAAAGGGDARLAALATLPFGAPGVLAVAAMGIVVLAETARVPIDNQETHYELTMIHEGLALEYGGWQLALVQSAAMIRQCCFLALAALLLPGAASPLVHAGWVAALAVAITVVETLFAKVRLFEVPQLLATAFVLACASVGLRAFGGSV